MHAFNVLIFYFLVTIVQLGQTITDWSASSIKPPVQQEHLRRAPAVVNTSTSGRTPSQEEQNPRSPVLIYPGKQKTNPKITTTVPLLQSTTTSQFWKPNPTKIGRSASNTGVTYLETVFYDASLDKTVCMDALEAPDPYQNSGETEISQSVFITTTPSTHLRAGFRYASVPTTTSTTTTTTTPTPRQVLRGRQGKPLVPLECPKPYGIFPHPNDCGKFVNCFEGRAFSHDCAPGTLFNSDLGECDHVYKVTCKLSRTPKPKPTPVPGRNSTKSPTGSSTVAPKQPVVPDSGQRLRLRGGVGPWEGYLEVRPNATQPWGHVCDQPDRWSLAEATVVCNQLGFLRGAERATQGAAFGPLTLEKAWLTSVECDGNEESLGQCKLQIGNDCALAEQLVGVRCRTGPVGLCSTEEQSHGTWCYRLHKEKVLRDVARGICEKEHANLVYITSQVENDFISEWLLNQYPPVNAIHTDGIATRALKRIFYLWEYNEQPFNFTRWWPDWKNNLTGNPGQEEQANCIVLRDRFKYHNDCAKVPYYFWALLRNCLNIPLPFICKKPQIDIGCINGNGFDYQGTANVSQSGRPCLTWDDPRINHVLARSSRLSISRQDQIALGRKGANITASHNYCRNPRGEEQPWCFVTPQSMEYCDIPRCAVDAKNALQSNTRCKMNQFQCKPGECISITWICDGEKDCSNGKDEESCQSYLSEFMHRKNAILRLHDVEKWMHTSLDTCARRCAEAKDFICKSFNFNPSQEECVLSDSNIGTSGDWTPSNEWDYYERKLFSVNCSNLFECTSGKCINNTAVCDGRNDCGDRADELVCQEELGFEIRLAGSNKTNEGRVEVKVFGVWGSVCDDLFNLNAADVICRELGFELGAAQAFTNGAFGDSQGPILMDNLQCKGNESSIKECEFEGWGKHNCFANETAGVRCHIASTDCKEHEWQCTHTHKCIPIEFLCDTVEDCGDQSDENPMECQSELQVRLADGTNERSGRVEIRYNNIWGTICDDEFGPEDAAVICKMLGFAPQGQVLPSGQVGPGKGPIWLDELKCTGLESSILECVRLPWAKHNCKHTEDVAIRCSPSPTQPQKINITSSSSLRPGTLPNTCGKRVVDDDPLDPLTVTPKILRGAPTKPGAYPWQVGLRIGGGGRPGTSHWCGAAVLSEYYIITAAHCLEDYPPGLHVLRVGDYHTELPDPEEEEFTIDTITTHPEYNLRLKYNNDIALIRIKAKDGRGIRFGTHVQPICLPPESTPYTAGLNCTISGWGSSVATGNAFTTRLQSATIPILGDDICRAPFVYGTDKLEGGMFCAGFLEGGVDACQGDSGGALVCPINGQPTIMGLTSWGFGCGRPNRPGVYTRVVNYLPWIYSVLSS